MNKNVISGLAVVITITICIIVLGILTTVKYLSGAILITGLVSASFHKNNK